MHIHTHVFETRDYVRITHYICTFLTSIATNINNVPVVDAKGHL